MRPDAFKNDDLIIREYPKKSAMEIHEALGIPLGSIAGVVRRHGLKHDDETIARLKKKLRYNLADKASYNEKWLANVRKGIRRARRRHEIQMSLTGKSEYGFKERTKPHSLCKANYFLRTARHYIRTDNPYLMLYDENTHRKSKRYSEQDYTDKYGIHFMSVEEYKNSEKEVGTSTTMPSEVVTSFIC